VALNTITLTLDVFMDRYVSIVSSYMYLIYPYPKVYMEKPIL